MIRIVVADDHDTLRRGVARMLTAEAGFQVVGEATNGIEAVRLVRELHPDVLVTDLEMPGLNGFQVIAAVREISPETRTVVLSMHNDRSYVNRAIATGALAYVTKDASGDDLALAIRAAFLGKRFVSGPSTMGFAPHLTPLK